MSVGLASTLYPQDPQPGAFPQQVDSPNKIHMHPSPRNEGTTSTRRITPFPPLEHANPTKRHSQLPPTQRKVLEPLLLGIVRVPSLHVSMTNGFWSKHSPPRYA